MLIQIQVKGLANAESVRKLAADKLQVSLSRYRHIVRMVTVHLADINGEKRGGLDKVCRVVLRLSNQSVLVIEELCEHIEQAICKVADRVHQSAARELQWAKSSRTGGRLARRLARA